MGNIHAQNGQALPATPTTGKESLERTLGNARAEFEGLSAAISTLEAALSYVSLRERAPDGCTKSAPMPATSAAIADVDRLAADIRTASDRVMALHRELQL